MFYYNKGIKINDTTLWLDAQKSVDVCCVSHGHMDHAKKHRTIIATDKTIRFLDKRIGKTKSISLKYNESLQVEACSVTLIPAGHILGSAQVLVEKEGTRCLYSGDFNLIECATAEPIEIPESDVLIMECTFGKPIYRFPERKIIEEQLLNFVQSTLKQNAVPVVIGYALGKAQEAMKILGKAGFSLSVHETVAQLAKIYEEFGIHFGHWEKFNKHEIDGKVLIVPPSASRTRMVKNLQNKRSVFLSGWAMHSGTRYRHGVDEALPLSDHADFDGLLEYIRRVKPKKIYTTHGFKEFPNHLKQLGFDAEPLKTVNQLSLF
ncbi:MAG: MBL fold metallo-hydrolase RNA specificity domain-containing protein [bacterium]